MLIGEISHWRNYHNEAGDFIENPDIPIDRVSTLRFVHNPTTPMGGIETYTTPDIDLLNKLSEQYPTDMLPFPEDE
ncbi:hypothetical protein [Nostoc sp. FACHB-892]|uniref:hypothetical protein n=1 Tax=Nostoc sp. FACHB-892 TaxID=2692843 RepID=UPI001A7E3E76|nr:hypothetical protein [Nostoc sp. FACHB-892]